MKLKKITAYAVMGTGPRGEVHLIIPSGYAGCYIIAGEDTGYNLIINYADTKMCLEIEKAIKEAT